MDTGFFNHIKTALLMGALIGLFVGAGALIGPQWIVPLAVLGLVLNVGTFLFSHKIAIAAMRGRRLTEETGGDLYRMTRDLAERAELPMPKLYLCPHKAPNAFATGPSPKFGAVAVTQGAVDLLTREEMAGVIAHELTHIKNRDTLITTIAATIAGVFSMMASSMFWLMPYFSMGGGRREGGNVLAMFAVIIVGAIGAALLKAMISRRREFMADEGAAKIVGSPDGLISALQKLEAVSRQVPLRQPNPAANNLFIIEPMMAAHGGGFDLGRLFATHPATAKRVAALSKLKR